MCAGGHAVRAGWALWRGSLTRAARAHTGPTTPAAHTGPTAQSAKTCGAIHLLTRHGHPIVRRVRRVRRMRLGALRVRATFRTRRRQGIELHFAGGYAAGGGESGGRACGANDTAWFANARSYDVQAHGRHDQLQTSETGPRGLHDAVCQHVRRARAIC